MDVVEQVATELEDTPVRFMHVEVYAGNDPANGYNRWMKQWGLQTEPWTFLVSREGVVVARFEGSVSVEELEAAVRSKLVRG